MLRNQQRDNKFTYPKHVCHTTVQPNGQLKVSSDTLWEKFKTSCFQTLVTNALNGKKYMIGHRPRLNKQSKHDWNGFKQYYTGK